MIVKWETNITNNKVKDVGKIKDAGITMIALVVTIVVLLILASITIGAVTSKNGILRNANDAKEQTEIAEEKEIVDRATIQAMGNNKRGNIVEDELQEQLDKITGNGKTEADDVGEEFEVAFIESKRYYTVDKDGTVTGPQEIVEDKSPGDITKDENGDDLKGDEDEPYEIWCIEDLIEWSNKYADYQNANINLCKNLNFKSKYSYANSERTDYGDINADNITDILIQEMQKGNGFPPIASFSGNFNAQDYKIDNIYIDYVGTTKNTGLFSTVYDSKISNLKISGNISGGSSAGIIGFGYGSVICNKVKNNCNIQGEKSGAGGIIGHYNNGSYYGMEKQLKLINCENTGNILGQNFTSVGGIVGYVYEPNSSSNQEVYIYNSCNQGTVETENGNAGGIIGYLNSDNTGYSNGRIYNCYNVGEVNAKGKNGQANGNEGGIYGLFRSMVSATLEIKKSYILSELNLKVGTSGWSCLVNGEKIGNDYINAEFLDKSYMQSQEFVNDLNGFKLEVEVLDNWVMKANSYPTFE